MIKELQGVISFCDNHDLLSLSYSELDRVDSCKVVAESSESSITVEEYFASSEWEVPIEVDEIPE